MTLEAVRLAKVSSWREQGQPTAQNIADDARSLLASILRPLRPDEQDRC